MFLHSRFSCLKKPKKTLIIAASKQSPQPLSKSAEAAVETEAQTEASQQPNRLSKACPQPPSEQNWVLQKHGCPQQTYVLQHQRSMPSLLFHWTRLPGGALQATHTKQLAKFATRTTDYTNECSTKHNGRRETQSLEIFLNCLIKSLKE